MSGTRARTRAVPAALAASALVLAGCGAEGADDGGEWTPQQPIEITAPADTGGGWDTLARTSSRIMEDAGLVDQSVQVVNKPGGGGAIGWSYIANNAGDPHKLFVTSPPILFVPLAGESDHDHSDFTPISRLATEYMTYLVPADSPMETFDDLVDELEDDPGAVSVAGGSAPGSMDHVALAGAADAAGVDAGELNYVAFDGGGEATTALLGGHVDAAVSGAGESMELIEAGEVKALAVSASERVDVLPDVPTLTELGVDFTFDIWRGVMGPPDMSQEEIAYYESVFAEMMEQDSWKEESSKLGWTDTYQDSADFEAFLDEKHTEFVDILDEVGLQ
ncbi:putative tricarboxylic transport membrane protein [Haloechinothrix alba]|uniref:Putative tricarboxylic transport membrane protein n=1 Tax=Haloechinothrix alba TaxID=664784 RepID=A0A238VWQ6_9PSEU|nr:tripartite tricarboxylate transporter substrate binding protein [Haloechinothrix alba]SNR37909.1 putative tricarboxylic transport membrane protein [Haloechinothrix alba]